MCSARRKAAGFDRFDEPTDRYHPAVILLKTAIVKMLTPCAEGEAAFRKLGFMKDEMGTMMESGPYMVGEKGPELVYTEPRLIRHPERWASRGAGSGDRSGRLEDGRRHPRHLGGRRKDASQKP